MKYDFDNTVERRDTDSVKWSRQAIESICGNPDAEPFWVADMDFQACPAIKEEAMKIAEKGVFGYPMGSDLPVIFSKWLAEKHGWSCDPSRICYAEGLLHAISLAVQLFTKPGDPVLVPSPTYKPFRDILEANGRVMIDHPLKYENGRYSLDHARILEDSKNAKMILFCSPHNPSGCVFSDEDLKRVLMCGRHFGIPVLSDEIHADLVHPGVKHIPMGLRNDEIGSDSITFMAPSKTFNIAGEHSAMVIFDDPWMKKKFEKAQKALHAVHPGFMAGALTKAAYTEGLDYNRELCAYLGENMKAMKEYIAENIPELSVTNGDASFVTFIDCSKIYDRVKADIEAHPEEYPAAPGGGIMSRFFGVKAGVCMNDGTWFGPQYGKFVRFNSGTSREKIMAALERMKDAVAALR